MQQQSMRANNTKEWQQKKKKLVENIFVDKEGVGEGERFESFASVYHFFVFMASDAQLPSKNRCQNNICLSGVPTKQPKYYKHVKNIIELQYPVFVT